MMAGSQESDADKNRRRVLEWAFYDVADVLAELVAAGVEAHLVEATRALSDRLRDASAAATRAAFFPGAAEKWVLSQLGHSAGT